MSRKEIHNFKPTHFNRLWCGQMRKTRCVVFFFFVVIIRTVLWIIIFLIAKAINYKSKIRERARFNFHLLIIPRMQSNTADAFSKEASLDLNAAFTICNRCSVDNSVLFSSHIVFGYKETIWIRLPSECFLLIVCPFSVFS